MQMPSGVTGSDKGREQVSIIVFALGSLVTIAGFVAVPFMGLSIKQVIAGEAALAFVAALNLGGLFIQLRRLRSMKRQERSATHT